MKRLNLTLSLVSLNVLLVTIERFSFTGHVLLQPYNFLRLHEVFQMGFIFLINVLLQFWILKEISKNFSTVRTGKGIFLIFVFIAGIYFYSTGNGVHELASFFFNTFCNTKHLTTIQCNGMFFNDYYFGNIVFFIGAFLTTISSVLIERDVPNKTFRKNDFLLLGFNSLVFGFTIFAYAAFDKVLVGLAYAIITSLVLVAIFLLRKTKAAFLPYTLYTVIAYVLGTLASLVVRFR